MVSDMLPGRAIGGPRAGILIEAPYTWDGRVKQRRKRSSTTVYYPGCYKWNMWDGTWEWCPDPKSTPKVKPAS